MKLKGPATTTTTISTGPDAGLTKSAKGGGAAGGGDEQFTRSYSQPAATPTSASMQQTARGRVSFRKAGNLKRFIVVAFFVIGLIVCVTSLICIILLPSFVTNQIAKRLVLKNNSLLLDRWSKPNVPMYFKVWLFDVKNAQEIVDKRGTKPKLKEIGPFVFHLKRQKDIVSFAGDNLYYTERRLFHFSPELSCCAINTTVTIPNIPLVAVVDRALSYNLPLVGRFIPRLINRAVQSLREQLFVRKQVREILFDGYDVELLKMVSRVGSLVGMPQTQQRFAILKGRNNTWRPEQDGVWAINTGARDRRQFGKVSSWNSYKQLPFWASPGCNQINGSDGTLFPPPIKKEEPLYIFNQELCRTVNLVYERPSDIRAISAYRYVLNPLNFAHTMPSSTPARQAGPTLRLTSPASVAASQEQRQPNSAIRSPPSGHQQQQQPPQDARVFTDATSDPLPLPAALRQQQAFQHHPNHYQRAQHSYRPGATASFVPVSIHKASHHQQQEPMITMAASSPLQSTTRKHTNAQETGAKPASRLAQGPEIASALPSSGNSRTRGEQEQLVLAAQALGEQNASAMNPQTCFCDRKSTNLNGVNVCEFDGLIELSKCTKQAQVVFGSMPHFYQSDPRLLRQVVGLEPNASKHTTYLDIEPNTGLVLGGKRRVQLNLIVKRNNDVEGFENINDMLIPVIWFEESAMIPEETAQKFKSLYTDRIRLVNLVLSSLFLAAFGLLLIDLRLMALQYSHYFHKLKISTVKGAASGMAAAAATGGVGSSASGRKLKHRQQAAGGGDGSSNDKPVSAQLAAATASIVPTSNGGASYERYFVTATSGDRKTAKLSLAALNLPLLANNKNRSASGQEAAPINAKAANKNPPSSLADRNLVQFAVHYNGANASPSACEGGRDNLSQLEAPHEQRSNFVSAKSVVSIDRQPAGSGKQARAVGASELIQESSPTLEASVSTSATTFD